MRSEHCFDTPLIIEGPDPKPYLDELPGLKDFPINNAIEDDGNSICKLTIKVLEQSVADGFEHDECDFTDVGTHGSALAFHRMSQDPDALVVDSRNHYNYEVGHFLNARHPDADAFREAIR